MISLVFQTNQFKKAVKRLSKEGRRSLEQIIRQVTENPGAGERKLGDLSEVWVYKFKIEKQLFLLAYTWAKEELIPIH